MNRRLSRRKSAWTTVRGPRGRSIHSPRRGTKASSSATWAGSRTTAVPLEEAGEHPGHDGRGEGVALRGGPVDPGARGEVVGPPSTGRAARPAGSSAAAAVAASQPASSSPWTAPSTSSSRSVNHASSGSTAQNRRRGRRTAHPGRHLGVEPHLDLVGPHDLAGGMTLGVGGRELADHGGRAGRHRLVLHREADGVGHLPGADRGGRDAHRPGVRAEQVTPAQHAGQPGGVDLVGGPQDVRRPPGPGGGAGRPVSHQRGGGRRSDRRRRGAPGR